MKKIIFIKHNYVKKFILKICKNLNIPLKESSRLCKSLIGSSLRGVDSHGIRLLPHYVKCIEKGRIKAKPKMKYIKKMPAVGLVDADNGFGHSAAYFACNKVTKLANAYGIGLVGIINSTHYGAAGAYSLEIAQNNFIGFCFTHSDAFATPFRGIKEFHGTNPYSFCAPINKKNNLIVDFSSTSIPWNKVIRARNNKQKIPKDVGFDKFGNPATNPHIVRSLAPLGGNLFGHKGFALSSSIEVLCGPLLGISHGYRLLSMLGPDFSTYRRLGHILIAINIKSFTTKEKYYKNMSNYINDLKSQKPSKKNRIFYPGQKELEEEKFRLHKGIPFDLEMQKDFIRMDKKYKIDFFDKLI